MRWEKYEKGRLTATLNLRLTVEEKSQMKDDAERASLTMSQLVRKRYFGRRVAWSPKVQNLKELRRIAEFLRQSDKHTDESGSILLSHVMLELIKLMGKLGRDC